jgi:regulator of RNase E activity RraB
LVLLQRSAGHEVNITGKAFSQVYDAMLRTGIQAGLTDTQMKKLMNNTRKMKEVVQGLGTEYRVKNGRILALDKATGRWMQTQAQVNVKEK